jgi:hypothetical protein
MSSTKRGKISARRRAAAVDALANIASDETKPAHSRVRAAASLLAAANKEDDAGDDPRGKRGRPPHLIVLPDNRRDGIRAEITRDDRGARLMVIATDPAELERLTAQAHAELDAMFPDDDAIS